MRQARRDLEAAVARHAAHLGVRVRKITLRDTTSRWGSCTSSGKLNFSWRLIMAPPFVLDYLAAHEVAHLQHGNHSLAFWKTVGSLSKDVAAAESWLRTHGMGLHRIGAEDERAGRRGCFPESCDFAEIAESGHLLRERWRRVRPGTGRRLAVDAPPPAPW